MWMRGVRPDGKMWKQLVAFWDGKFHCLPEYEFVESTGGARRTA